MVNNDSGIETGSKEKDKKERKIRLGQKIEDGLVLVVFTKIYGRNIKALIDSNAARCFITSACATMCGLKAKP